MSSEEVCKYRASFPTERSAMAGTRPGWVAYKCAEHGAWHLGKET